MIFVAGTLAQNRLRTKKINFGTILFKHWQTLRENKQFPSCAILNSVQGSWLTRIPLNVIIDLHTVTFNITIMSICQYFSFLLIFKVSFVMSTYGNLKYLVKLLQKKILSNEAITKYWGQTWFYAVHMSEKFHLNLIMMYLTCKMHLRNSKRMFKDSKSVIITCIVPMCTFCYLSDYLTKFSHD